MNSTQIQTLRHIRATEAQVNAILYGLEAKTGSADGDVSTHRVNSLTETYGILIDVAEALAAAAKAVPRAGDPLESESGEGE